MFFVGMVVFVALYYWFVLWLYKRLVKKSWPRYIKLLVLTVVLIAPWVDQIMKYVVLQQGYCRVDAGKLGNIRYVPPVNPIPIKISEVSWFGEPFPTKVGKFAPKYSIENLPYFLTWEHARNERINGYQGSLKTGIFEENRFLCFISDKVQPCIVKNYKQILKRETINFAGIEIAHKTTTELRRSDILMAEGLGYDWRGSIPFRIFPGFEISLFHTDNGNGCGADPHPPGTLSFEVEK